MNCPTCLPLNDTRNNFIYVPQPPENIIVSVFYVPGGTWSSQFAVTQWTQRTYNPMQCIWTDRFYALAEEKNTPSFVFSWSWRFVAGFTPAVVQRNDGLHIYHEGRWEMDHRVLPLCHGRNCLFSSINCQCIGLQRECLAARLCHNSFKTSSFYTFNLNIVWLNSS